MSPNGDCVCLSCMSIMYMELFSAQDKSFPEEQKDFLLGLLEKSELHYCTSKRLWVRIYCMLSNLGRVHPPASPYRHMSSSCQKDLLIACQSFPYGPRGAEQIMMKYPCQIAKPSLPRISTAMSKCKSTLYRHFLALSLWACWLIQMMSLSSLPRKWQT